MTYDNSKLHFLNVEIKTFFNVEIKTAGNALQMEVYRKPFDPNSYIAVDSFYTGHLERNLMYS